MKYKRRRRMIRVRTRSQSLINSKHPSVSEKSTKLDVILDHHHQNLKNEKRTKYLKQLCIVCVISFILLAIIIIIGGCIIRIKSYPAKSVYLRWNSSGITVAGTGIAGSAANELRSPWDMVVDRFNTLFISDGANNRVQRFLRDSLNGTTVSGQSSGASGISSMYCNRTSGVLMDTHNNIYLGDMYNNRVQLWPNGYLDSINIAGNGILGNSMTQLYYPHNIEFHSSLNILYVTDSYNNRIMSYENKQLSGTVVAGGNSAGPPTSKLTSPHAVFYDEISNSLLIANYYSHNIVRWILGEKNWTLVAGSSSGQSGNISTRFQLTTDVMLDPMGNMYVVDRSNHRIQFFPPNQSSGQTIAGITNVCRNNATTLCYPNSVVMDNQLNLYVVDHGGHRIQKFLRF